MSENSLRISVLLRLLISLISNSANLKFCVLAKSFTCLLTRTFSLKFDDDTPRNDTHVHVVSHYASFHYTRTFCTAFCFFYLSLLSFLCHFYLSRSAQYNIIRAFPFFLFCVLTLRRNYCQVRTYALMSAKALRMKNVCNLCVRREQLCRQLCDIIYVLTHNSISLFLRRNYNPTSETI